MIFPAILVTVISVFKASVQTELNTFFAHLAKQAYLTRKAIAKAFSKVRTILSWRFGVVSRSALICQAWRCYCPQNCTAPMLEGGSAV